MSKFPVEVSDDGGLVDAVNYLLSGPQGLGQFFKGFNAYKPAYLTSNFRIPFTRTAPENIYYPDIAISNAQQLDDRTYKFTFATPQPIVPYNLGNGLYVSGINPVEWNSASYSPGSALLHPAQIGVVECTTTYVIIRDRDILPTLPAYVSGGTLTFSAMNTTNSTDANARVVTTGVTDRVFISAQLDNTMTYTCSAPTSINYYVQVNRYKAAPTYDPINPDFVFIDQTVISEKKYTIPLVATTLGVSTFTFAGTKDDTDTVTYEITPTTTTGSGSGLKVSVTLQATSSGPIPYSGANTAITIISPGSGYNIGDILTIPGSNLGLDTLANDLVLTITSVLGAGTISTATIPEIETVFTTVIDNPKPGYYWYILEVYFESQSGFAGTVEMYQNEFGLRSLSAQVVKE